MSGKDKETFADFKDKCQEQCDNALNNFFEGKEYNVEEGKEMSETISKNLIEELTNDGPKGYKFMVNTIVFPKNAATVHSSGNCFWDTDNDGCIRSKYENDTLHALSVIFFSKA